MSEAEKQKIVIQISAVQTELQRTIDERYVDGPVVIVVQSESGIWTSKVRTGAR